MFLSFGRFHGGKHVATMPPHSCDQAIRTDRAACGAQKTCAQCTVGVKPSGRNTKARRGCMSCGPWHYRHEVGSSAAVSSSNGIRGLRLSRPVVRGVNRGGAETPRPAGVACLAGLGTTAAESPSAAVSSSNGIRGLRLSRPVVMGVKRASRSSLVLLSAPTGGAT